MAWRAFIHFKNDEEEEGPSRGDITAAVRDLQDLLAKEDVYYDDIQYVQVENLD